MANILLQILDDGRITDSQGRVVNFANTIVILTSNIGSSYLLENHGGISESTEDLVLKALRAHFKPELLNRMDDIVMFHALGEEHFVQIAKKYMKELQQKLTAQEISLEVEDEVYSWIVEKGVDAAFGARPLKRYIQRHIETQVAKQLIKGDILPGQTLHLTIENGKVVVE